MFLTALYIHFGQVFRSTVDSSCTGLCQYEYTPEGVCTSNEEEEDEYQNLFVFFDLYSKYI